MDILANDLSVHGQFHDVPAFQAALDRIMDIRRVARAFQRDVYSSSAFLISQPIRNMPMQQAITRIPDKNKRLSAMSWLTRGGPFWDELQGHGADDWLEYRGDIVTNTAVGEAAYCTLHGIERGLASFTPSNWSFSPIEVVWVYGKDESERRSTAIKNWLDAATLETELRDAAPPVRSWDQLRDISTTRFDRLTFASDCFAPLDGTPFARSSADRILVLLDILHRFAEAFDLSGKRTATGHRIYQNYFTGRQALFSDSSDSEKRNFHNELTFPHPDDPGSRLFCPMHGKERHLTLRLHYSWSGQAWDPVYIAYIGPKLTRR